MRIKILLLAALLHLSACSYNIDTAKNLNVSEMNLSPTNLNINIVDQDAWDMEVVKLGIVCSAHDYKFLFSKHVEASLTALDKDGELQSADADLTLVPLSARATTRCYSKTFVSGACDTDLKLTGKLVSMSKADKEFTIEQHASAPTSMCEGVENSLNILAKAANEQIIEYIRQYNKK